MSFNINSIIPYYLNNKQIRHAVGLFVSSIITVVLSFYIHKYLTSHFSPEDYGSFNVLLRLFSILFIFPFSK